jgi:LPXTG-motif cell wall-anchored protein
VGATRGMHREALTTLGLVVLSALLVEPGLAGPIIGYLSNLVKLIVAFIVSHFSVNPKVLLDTYANTTVPFTTENPYAFLIFALIAFVLLSYTSRGAKDITALSRLLGGLLGLLNGFLVISLFKEYIVKYIQKRSSAVAALGPPAQVSVALKGLPLTGPLTGSGSQFVVMILAGVAALLLLSSVVGRSRKADKRDKKG